MAKAQKKNKAQNEVTTVVSTDNVENAKKDLAAMPEGTSISESIRQLAAKGYSRGDIAKATGKRYQHVRNVLITPLKRPVSDKAE